MGTVSRLADRQQTDRVALAAADDEIAFRRIIAAHHEDMRRVCLAFSGDPSVAEEAVQTAWLVGSYTDEGCGGVAHYHGTTWTSYLVESCIEEFATAPDGSVWLGAADASPRLHTYVITPEAVAATE